MKIRNDFVSNSSSTSFIVTANDKFVNDFKVFSIVDSMVFRPNADKFSDELFISLRDNNYLGKYASTKYLQFNAKNYLANPDIDLLKKLIDESNKNVSVQYGDDCTMISAFYAYALWLQSQGFIIGNDEDSSLEMLDIKHYDYLLN